MRIYILSLIVFCFALQGAAQNGELLKNKKITWVGESFQNIVTESSMNHAMGDSLSIVFLQKYVALKGMNISEWIAPTLLFKAMYEQKIKIFNDPQLTIMNPDGLAMIQDTIRKLDIVTNELNISIENIEVDPKMIAYFSVYQMYYYDSELGELIVKPISFAPVVKYKNSFKPLCWIEIVEIKNKPDLSNAALNWSSDIYYSDIPYLSGVHKNIKTLKEIDKNPLMSNFRAFKNKKSIDFYSIAEKYEWIKWTPEAREAAFIEVKIDTVRTFDVQTDSTIWNFVERVVDLHAFKPIQTWSWNAVKNQFEVYTFSIAYMQPYFDVNHKFLYYYPYYYQRLDE
jgi:hypothetical protein